MKTHEFARNLEFIAKLLRTLPNIEMNEAIATNLQLNLNLSKPSPNKASNRALRPLPLGILQQLAEKSPAEVETFLASEDEPFSVTQLTQLASQLGVSTSKRQSKNALINLITRHFEAGQMHSIIRGARKEET